MWQSLKRTSFSRINNSFQLRSYYSINETLHRVKTEEKKVTKFKPSYKTVRLKFGFQARESIVKGIDRLSKTAALTLGPGGRNVALEYEAGEPKITKDGVTVVKSIIEPIREEDMGARLMKKIAGNTNLYAGDGTTTSTLLANELLKKGFHAVEFAGAHPIALKRGMDKALKVVLDYLKQMSMPVNTELEIFNICMVSSNHNEGIARIIAKTMTSVGLNGNVNIVESPTGETLFNLVNGMVFDRGFVTEAFVTEHQVEQKCELEFPLVLVVTNKIKDVKEIMPILELVKKTKRSFVLFSEDLQEDPMSMMVYNNSKDIVKCCAVNVPWMANVQQEILKDIAISTGATLIDNEYSIKLEEVKIEHFGAAKKIVIDPYGTHIVAGSGDKNAIQDRILEIAHQITQEQSNNLKQVLRERYNRMSSKIAEIEVGGGSDAIKGEIRDIIVDSLNSAKSAMQSGMLPGGGVALYQAAKILESGLPHLVEEESERLGVKVMEEALKMPIRMVIENKLGYDCSGILSQIDKGENFFTGFDCKKEVICDMIDSGVVDSFNVIKTILQDSVSLAGLLITTECLVIKEKQYEPLPLKHYQDKRDFF